MGNKIQRIYIGTNLVRPKYEFNPLTQPYPTIAQSGLNIREVVLEAGYNTSTAGNFSLKIYNTGTSATKDIGFRLFQGSSWKGSTDYGYIFSDNPSWSIITTFNSSWTTSSKGFCRLTFGKTSGRLQVGQTKDNRIYDGTYNYTTAVQNIITGIFTSQQSITALYGSTGNAIDGKVTVLYEKA